MSRIDPRPAPCAKSACAARPYGPVLLCGASGAAGPDSRRRCRARPGRGSPRPEPSAKAAPSVSRVNPVPHHLACWLRRLSSPRFLRSWSLSSSRQGSFPVSPLLQIPGFQPGLRRVLLVFRPRASPHALDQADHACAVLRFQQIATGRRRRFVQTAHLPAFDASRSTVTTLCHARL